jgi:hypothetical protein
MPLLCKARVTSSLSRPSLDEIAAAVLVAMAPLGHPVAERYVRSMRSIAVSQVGAEESGDNGKQADWVYFGLAAMSPRERDLACLRDATAATPRLTLARLCEALDASGRGFLSLADLERACAEAAPALGRQAVARAFADADVLAGAPEGVPSGSAAGGGGHGWSKHGGGGEPKRGR